MRMMPMLPQINPLPRPKSQFAMFERDTEIYGGKRRPNMRRHVVFAFRSMLEDGIAVRTNP